MNYDKYLLDHIFDMYRSQKFGYNELCLKCKGHSRNKGYPLTFGPVPIFHVGKNYSKQAQKILIVGKVAYGWGDIFPDFHNVWHNFFDNNGNHIELIQDKVEGTIEKLFFNQAENKNTKYFTFLRYAFKEIMGNAKDAFDAISISNVVHCNDGNTKDLLRQKVRDYCGSKIKNGFIHKEIEILRPTHILLLTTDDKYKRYFDGLEMNYKCITHPSAPGRSKESFKKDIENFISG